MPFYVSVGPRGILFRIGMILTGTMGSVSYWWACRDRPEITLPTSSPRVLPTHGVDDSNPTLPRGNEA
jgi:hypothetical protein